MQQTEIDKHTQRQDLHFQKKKRVAWRYLTVAGKSYCCYCWGRPECSWSGTVEDCAGAFPGVCPSGTPICTDRNNAIQSGKVV